MHGCHQRHLNRLQKHAKQDISNLYRGMVSSAGCIRGAKRASSLGEKLMEMVVLNAGTMAKDRMLKNRQ